MTEVMPEEEAESMTPSSGVLRRTGSFPHVRCAENCPNAVWQVVKPPKRGDLTQRVFCTLMHAIVDEEIMDCDGPEFQPPNQGGEEA